MDYLTLLQSVLGFTVGLFVLNAVGALIAYSQKKRNLRDVEEQLRKTTFVLSGTISDNNFVAHICALCNQKRDGVLHIIAGRRRGYLLFRRGTIIDGFYRNMYGESGVAEALTLKEGDYFFESRVVRQLNLVNRQFDILSQQCSCGK